MNIVQIQNDLKDLSDQQLGMTMQTGSAPQYLILSEMQRRQKMRQEAQTPNGDPAGDRSVAEDIMTGGQQRPPMPQQRPPAPQGGVPAARPVPPMPQNAMAYGGLVSFASGGNVSEMGQAYQRGLMQAAYRNPITGELEEPPAEGKMYKPDPRKKGAPKMERSGLDYLYDGMMSGFQKKMAGGKKKGYEQGGTVKSFEEQLAEFRAAEEGLPPNVMPENPYGMDPMAGSVLRYQPGQLNPYATEAWLDRPPGEKTEREKELLRRQGLPPSPENMSLISDEVETKLAETPSEVADPSAGTITPNTAEYYDWDKEVPPEKPAPDQKTGPSVTREPTKKAPATGEQSGKTVETTRSTEVADPQAAAPRGIDRSKLGEWLFRTGLGGLAAGDPLGARSMGASGLSAYNQMRSEEEAQLDREQEMEALRLQEAGKDRRNNDMVGANAKAARLDQLMNAVSKAEDAYRAYEIQARKEIQDTRFTTRGDNVMDPNYIEKEIQRRRNDPTTALGQAALRYQRLAQQAGLQPIIGGAGAPQSAARTGPAGAVTTQ